MIKGMAKPRIMFVHGMDERTPDIESLAEETPAPTEDEGLSYKFSQKLSMHLTSFICFIKYMMHCCPHWNLNMSNTCMTLNDYVFFFWTDGKLLPTPILFTLRSIAKENDFIPASRDLFVGCVRTMAVSQKKVRILSVLFQLLIHLCAQIPFQFIQNLIHVLSLWQPW